MKLYQSATSPFVLKVRIAAAELGLLDRIEMLDVSQEYKAGGPLAREQNIIKTNPLGQVPTLLTEGGSTIADSRVICEYLDRLGGGSLFPAAPTARWNALTEQSYGDGLLDAALAARYEGLLRSEEQRWQRWIDGQLAKVHATLLAGDPNELTVTEVANRWGFGHHGHFAAAYRAQFSESPSQTLNNRAAPPKSGNPKGA